MITTFVNVEFSNEFYYYFFFNRIKACVRPILTLSAYARFLIKRRLIAPDKSSDKSKRWKNGRSAL